MPKKQIKKSKAKNIILAIAIAILFVMFIAYAIETIYPSPKYEDYCVQRMYENKTQCESLGGQWNYPNDNLNVAEGKEPIPSPELGYCINTKCSDDYTSKTEIYNRNIFFISLIIGIVTIIVAVLLSLESVSSGFMAGGVLLIIYGTIRYWGSLSNWLRTLMLALALAVLVWIGYKKLK